MASSSSSPRNCVYDVFPSFSGKDVRVTFLSHFLKELDRKLIIAFKDNEIKRSSSLDPELKQAIKDSRIAVVVFSKHYASSSWCLNELLEIVKCKEKYDQIVIPLFYGLDPSHVRKQTGEFGKFFEKTCHNKTKEVKIQWRRALTNVANILGYHSVKWYDSIYKSLNKMLLPVCEMISLLIRDNEAEMIEKIVNDILVKLLLTTSKDFEEFVGMEDHIAMMSVLLELKSEKVRMVGIWGSSGIGKTTIARVLFNQISHHFQGSVFIDKRFISKSMEIFSKVNPDDYNMKLHLQDSFLSKILDKEGIEVDHLGAVREKLKHRKVLIVIDDLDDQVVLDALAGQTDWFGSGSRIIVITKDMHFLRAHGIDHIYKVCLPCDDLALKMLCRSAFRQNSPPGNLMELASEIALHAGNLPLVVNVLGSYLRGRDKAEWIDVLTKLRNGLDGKIEKTLKVSYDGLSNKKFEALFRHIACIFNGEKVNDIKLLLANCDLDVNIGFKNLVDKSLVHVREDTVEMHRLLHELGREIVRTQSNEPGEREFLVDSKDICNVLKDNTGTTKVLGIAFDIDETDEVRIHESAFKEMRNLLFLKFYTKQKKEVRWNLANGFNCFPSKLRLLSWEKYPLRCMPSNFCPQNLVKLQMQESKLEKLWEGVHSLRGLKDIDLQGSRSLKEIPDLSMATNLETLNLCDCSSLVELPSSIQYLNKLEKLVMSGCSNLETLPTGINLQSLNRFDLKGCTRLKSFPDISANIGVLILSETSIDEFPSNPRLENLLFLFMCTMKSEKLWERPQPLEPIMTMISPSLTKLWLSDIPSLVELPSTLQNLHNLQYLSITECINLEFLPTGINLKYLFYLDLTGCSRLRSFPDISTNVSYLILDKTAIAEIPRWIENFSCLSCLRMAGCHNLQYVSFNISKLKNLVKVDFSDCGALSKAHLNGYPNEVVIGRDNNHSKLPVPCETSSSFSRQYLRLEFINCFNLDQAALIEQLSVFMQLILSGEEVPSYFTHRTSGTSFTIPLLQISPSRKIFKFKACVVVECKSVPLGHHFPFAIQVCCRFTERLGNHFDLANRPLYFSKFKLGSQLVIFECSFLLNKDNDPLTELNYDHVDIQLQISQLSGDSPFKLKGWGVAPSYHEVRSFSCGYVTRAPKLSRQRWR